MGGGNFVLPEVVVLGGLRSPHGVGDIGEPCRHTRARSACSAVTAVGSYKATDVYDDEGTLYKTTLRPGRGLYHYIVSAHGTTLSTTSGYSVTLTYNPDGSIATYRETGMVFSFTIPGEGGVLLLHAGHLVLDLNTDEVTFEAGPRGEDFSRLCAALR
jgi:hypothetical protein